MQQGFTLLELLVVLAIIGILASISYPIYTQHVLKTQRAQAQVALLDLASGMERYYALHHSYAGANLATLGMEEYITSRFYRLEISAQDHTYLLQAIPMNPPQDQDMCGSMRLNEVGKKSISGSGSVQVCWGM